jgi:hypothetical protein
MAAPRGRPKKSTALVSPSRKVYEGEIEPEEPVKRLPRARTPEAREAQLVALSYDLAEKQILEGTASSQVVVHFLKIGSTREKQELQKMKQETLLVEAKVKDLANVEEMKKLYVEAMDAMRGYAGQEASTDDNPDVF